MGMAWLNEKHANTGPVGWRWPRRRRRLMVDVEEVFARAEDVMAIAERLREVADPRGVVTAEIGRLHTLARDLLRWTR